MYLRKYMGKRTRGTRLLILATVVILGYLFSVQTLLPSDLFKSSAAKSGCFSASSSLKRHLLAAVTTEGNEPASNKTNETQKAPLFPEDLFTLEERQHGAVILHILGMIYMFVALAIVCDEFFIPALDVIIEKLEIQDDVAGATFMAAGGSAPELFTSVIGVFFSFDDVGIGTIVGSAVFNILFVIGMCALFSKSVLYLTWWPLFRDVSFYSVSLIVLILFFLDSKIYWWEALLLLIIYAAYVYFMRWNVQLERFVKKHITKNKVARVSSADQLVTSHLLEICATEGAKHNVLVEQNDRKWFFENGAPVVVAKPIQVGDAHVHPPSTVSETGPNPHRRASTPLIHAGSKFRHGLLQLMIHSIDPLNEGQQERIDEKSTQIHAIASLKVLLDATRQSNAASTPGTTTTTAGGSESDSQDNLAGTDKAITAGTDSGQSSQDAETTVESEFRQRDSVVSIKGDKGIVTTESANQLNNVANHVSSSNGADLAKIEAAEEDGKEPLDLGWPDTARKRLTYVMLLPIILPLWLTLPDTRREEKKKWFVCTFVGSIVWIAIFSYLMVWWATLAGQTLRIPNEVMGLTFLAAGTSIPDLITSVIVARKGLGDMAVSSSIGSNIFDVTVGLPLPWLLYGLTHMGDPVPVSSQGMACSICILFLMLMFVIATIACFNWKMNKGLGISMFILYFAFLAVSLLFEYGVWVCPL